MSTMLTMHSSARTTGNSSTATLQRQFGSTITATSLLFIALPVISVSCDAGCGRSSTHARTRTILRYITLDITPCSLTCWCAIFCAHFVSRKLLMLRSRWAGSHVHTTPAQIRFHMNRQLAQQVDNMWQSVVSHTFKYMYAYVHSSEGSPAIGCHGFPRSIPARSL